MLKLCKYWEVMKCRRDKCSCDDLLFIDVSSTYSNICVVEGIDKLKMELQGRKNIPSSINTYDDQKYQKDKAA